MGYLDNIPHEMRDRKQWMLAGPDKAPRAIDWANESSYPGAKNNPDQRMTYIEAREWAETLGLFMGYVPLPDDPFTIIDLDWKDDKVYDVSAQDIKVGLYTQACEETYVERSMSGKGAHIVVSGKLAHDFNAQNAGIECYGNKGFVVITGRMESQTNTIAPKQDWLDYLVTKFPRAIDDAQFADTKLDRQQIDHASAEELALDDKFAEWVDSWRNKETVDGWMQDKPGDDRSAVDMKVMQLFVKFSRDRQHPDESAVRMFLRCPRGKLLARKQDVSQYLMRTLVGAKARVAMDDKRAKDFDMGAGSRAMLDAFLAKMPKPAGEAQAEPQQAGAPINMGGMGQKAPSAAPEFSGFKWLTADDLETQPDIDWVVKGIFPTKGVGAVYGESGAGKSLVVMDMLAAIADGKKWFNLRTKQLPVSIFALEGEGGLKGRKRAWEKQHDRKYPNSIYFWDSSANGQFALRDGSPDPTQRDYHKQRLIQLCADLIANGRRGGVVVIDTLNQASDGADENSSRDMGELLRAMKFIQRETESLVLIVHHATKSKENQSMRGHSSLYGAMDGIMEVVRDVYTMDGALWNDRRAWLIKKAKDGRDGGEYFFDMVEHDVGMTELDGPIKGVAIKEVPRCLIDEQGAILDLFCGSLTKPAGGAGKAGGRTASAPKQAAGDRQAPDVTRKGAQNAPTWPDGEQAAAPQVTQPRSGKQSAQQNANRYNIAAVIDRAFVVDYERTRSANKGLHGAPADRIATPRDDLVTIITDLINPDENDAAFKTAVKNALNYAVNSGKLARNTEHGKQYLWPA